MTHLPFTAMQSQTDRTIRSLNVGFEDKNQWNGYHNPLTLHLLTFTCGTIWKPRFMLQKYTMSSIVKTKFLLYVVRSHHNTLSSWIDKNICISMNGGHIQHPILPMVPDLWMNCIMYFMEIIYGSIQDLKFSHWWILRIQFLEYHVPNTVILIYSMFKHWDISPSLEAPVLELASQGEHLTSSQSMHRITILPYSLLYHL
jgi:hypothetical protein